MEDRDRKVDKSRNKDQAAMQEQLSQGIKKENSREDFQTYFLNKENFNKLCDECINGDLKTLRCRFTAWRAFLGLIPVGDEAKIRDEVKKQRKFYAGEYEKYMNFRGKVQLSAEVDNPLSTASSNPWNSFYGDSELKDEIKKDIERTYQDLEFFCTKPAQVLLTNVLFIWSKQNPDLSYRQGMNELAAVLTYACFTENYKPSKPQTDIYDFLNDQEFAEADIYTAFKRILELDQKNMFVVTQPTGKNGKPIKKKEGDAPNRPNLPVVHRAVYIQEELLPKVNEELFNHYQTLQVEPHIYLMRWLRCMLVREFNIQQAFCVWDAVFAHHIRHTPKSPKFDMIDYLCIAMMISISKQLLDIDNGGMLLGKLLKYPPVDNVHFLIKNCQTGVLDVLNSEEGKQKQGTQQLLSIGKEEEKKPTVGAKKVVLFNPSVPILSAKETKEEKTEPKVTKDKIQSPLSSEPQTITKPKSPKNEEPVKKPEPTATKTEKPSVPSKIFESKAAATEKPTTVDFKVNTQKANPFGSAASRKLETKTVAETSEGPLILFSKSSSTTTEKKEAPALFKPSKSAEQKDSPLDDSPPKKTTASAGFNNNTVDILGSSNLQKEYSEQIKKLQNAIKLVKIENEKNVSMGINEALEDMNDVLKFLRKQMA